MRTLKQTREQAGLKIKMNLYCRRSSNPKGDKIASAWISGRNTREKYQELRSRRGQHITTVNSMT